MNTVTSVTSRHTEYEIGDAKARAEKLDRSELPANLSSFVNDCGFIDNAVNDLRNYYLKSETYNKSEIDSRLSVKWNSEFVTELPTEDISTSTIYFLLRPNPEQEQNDVYDEYIYTGQWELIGNTYVDLSNYYTKSETNTQIDNKVAVETLARQQADSTLQNNIDTTQSNLSTTNQNLNAEILARQQADLRHEEDISTNATNISAEVTRATNAESSLSNRVDATETHVASRSNPHNVTKSQIGLGNVTNVATSSTIEPNSNKNITSGAIYSALENKVDKVQGKGLSDENYTLTEKTKLAGLNNYDDTALSNRVTATENAITTLNGDSTVAGSVDEKISDALAGVTQIDFQIVQELPQTGVKGVIYFVVDTLGEENTYNEYVWVNNSWELIGQTISKIDLSDYYKKSEVNALVSVKNDKITVTNDTTDLTDDDSFDETSAGTNPTATKRRLLTSLWAYIKNKMTGGISSIITSNLTASRTLVSNSSGKVAVSSTTSTELGYVHGVTSAIQTQLNAKVGTGRKVNGHALSADVTVTKDDVSLGNVANIDQSKAIKNITRNGTTFTATCLDDTTFTFTQKDDNTTYSPATQSANGLMSSTDKTKLDGIEDGAQVNTITGVKGNSETDYRTGNVNITKANIGLGNVDNTADSSKSVKDANNTYSLNKSVTCSTNASDPAKTVTLAGFNLIKGARLIVYLSNANASASALTLNVNSTGAKTIRWNGSVTSATVYAMTAGYYNCYYDGTYWNMDSSYEARSARVSASADFATQSDYNRSTAYCTTASATQAKVANMRGYVLAKGSFLITFTQANTYNGKITLNVNSKGAKDVYINGEISSSTNKTLPAGTYLCQYDGTNYYIEIEKGINSARNSNNATYATNLGDSNSSYSKTNLDTALGNKVDKVSGKGLSTNDFTDTLKTKLDGIESGAQVNSITGVKGNSESAYRTGNVNITKSNIGLGNVDNTTDANKAVASAGKLTTARKVYVKLGTASTSETKDFSGDTAIPVNGTLGAGNGGTGETSLKDSANALINALDTGSSTPVDNDYYVSQYVSGGTTTTTFHRRPMSALWNYIKGKLSITTSGSGNAITALSFSNGVFTATKGSTFLTSHQDISGKTNLTVVAPAFSTSTAYTVGQYVIYDQKLYKCTTAHSAGAWNSSHFTQVTIAGSLFSGNYNDLTNKPTLGTASAKNVPSSGNASSSQVVMGNDTRLSDSRPASDVSAWAKASTKPTYNANEVGAIASTLKGAVNGVAELDADGKVPSSQLPSYVDDVEEYASTSDFPETGESGKIYVAIDTNKTYRWGGTDYVEISSSLALGETSSTAYRGDRGKTAYNHSQLTSGNPHNVTKSDVGLSNVANTGDSATPISGGTTKFTTGGAYTELNKKASTIDGFSAVENLGYTKDQDVFITDFINKVIGTYPRTKSCTMIKISWSVANNVNLVFVPSPTSASTRIATSGLTIIGNIIKISSSTNWVDMNLILIDTNNTQYRCRITKGEASSSISVSLIRLQNALSNATQSANGLMSSTDKTKLDGIASGAEVNVQPDWNQTDTTADDYIKNKPVIYYYGTCATSRANVAKVVTCANFVLETGCRILVKFTDTAGDAPTSGDMSLNINSTGAKAVYNKNNTRMTYAYSREFRNNRYCEFVYDGTNFIWVNYDSNTTYSTITQAEITAGTSTSSRLVTPKLLGDNFVKKESGKGLSTNDFTTALKTKLENMGTNDGIVFEIVEYEN